MQITHPRQSRRHLTSRRSLMLMGALAVTIALPSGAFATFETAYIEQSRSGMIEVLVQQPAGVPGTRIYKHNSSYNWVETDSYKDYLYAPAIGPGDVRYYLNNKTITKIGSDDKAVQYASFQHPSNWKVWDMATCGTKVCPLAWGGYWGDSQIGVVSSNSTTVWGPAYFNNDSRVYDMVESQGRLYTLAQTNWDHPEFIGDHVWLSQYDLNGNALAGFGLGPYTGVLAMARSGDARFVYLMEYLIDDRTVTVKKIDVTNGQTAASQTRRVDGWYMQDIAYYPQTRQVVAVGTSTSENRYVLAPFPEDLSSASPLRSFNQ
jgi:hypothetical protein